MKNKLLAILIFSWVLLLASGCSSAVNSPTPNLKSGTVNESYLGVEQPSLSPKFKITQDELDNGIKKEPIKSATGQILPPESRVNDNSGKIQDKRGTDNAAKPNI